MGKIINLIDRSRVEAREECPQMRFLNYDFDNDGLDTEGMSLPLLSGIAIHAAHARLLAGHDLETVLTEVLGDYKQAIRTKGLFGLEVTQTIIKEQSYLLEGMLRVWAATRLPLILLDYEVVSIEKTFDWELAPGLVQRLRFDAILRRKDDGLLFILDYKTVGYPSEMWLEKFEHSLQTCLYLLALKEHVAEPVGGILYEGLVKGQFKKETTKLASWCGEKVQQSPYTMAFVLRGEAGSIYQSAYTNRKGYSKVRLFEEMPAKQWVEQWLMPEGTNELFISVPAISPPDSELRDVKAQTIFEEQNYYVSLTVYRQMLASGYEQEAAARYVKEFAPKRTGRCFKFGHDNRCRFIDICFNEGAQPLAEGGGYVKRVPHHDTDLEMIA